MKTESQDCKPRDASTGKFKTTHGHRLVRTPTYYSWESMRARCLRPAHNSYHRYGGRGITICERWLHDFAAFLADMGERPSVHYQLERIDSNGHYEPGNCRWATVKEQHRNKRSNRKITHNGVTGTGSFWAEQSTLPGINSTIVCARWDRGWPMEKILTTPVRPIKPRRKKL